MPSFTSKPPIDDAPQCARKPNDQVNGQMLTSVKPIKSPANSALLTLFDTGGVLIATTKHRHQDESR
jgi:hypothetical protein